MRRYTWNDAAGTLTVELAIPTVDRLALESLEAFKAVPRGGLEIGGLLLGSRDSSTGCTRIRIDNYVSVASEYRSGPYYALSPFDLETLHQAVAQHPDAVGMYRTVTHAENPVLQSDDHSVFERHFTSEGNVFLLIHPASRTAAFYVWSPKGLAMVHRFPFEAGVLSHGSTEPAESEPETETEAQPKVDTAPPRPSVILAGPSRSRTWLMRAVALVAGGIIGALAWHRTAPVPPAPAAQVSAPVPVRLALNVVRDGRSLRLVWNPDLPVVRAADHGTLQISDGNRETHLNLTAAELSAGALVYWPETLNIAFRMEIFRGAEKNDAEILAVADLTDPVRSPGPSTASPPVKPAEVATAHRWAAAPPDTSSMAAAPAHEVPKADTRNPPLPSQVKLEDTVALPSKQDSLTPSHPPQAAVPPHAELAASAAPSRPAHIVTIPASAHLPEPTIEISAEPVPPSRWSRMAHHIPLLGRLKKQRQVAVPPQPVHESKPALTAAERHDLTEEVPIDVRVYITESGKVDFAELVDGSSFSRHSQLADAAIFAARHWDFQPARIGEENVPSEVILHFRFKPAETAQP